MRQLNALGLLVGVGLLLQTYACKPRRDDALLQGLDGRASEACHSPEPSSYLVSRYEGELAATTGDPQLNADQLRILSESSDAKITAYAPFKSSRRFSTRQFNYVDQDIYYAVYSCSLSLGGKNVCGSAVKHLHMNGIHPIRDPLFVDPIQGSDEAQKRISALAVTSDYSRKVAFVEGDTTIRLLVSHENQPYSVYKVLHVDRKVTGLVFFKAEGFRPTDLGGDKLLIQTADGKWVWHVDRAIGPVVIGHHNEVAENHGSFWKWANFNEMFSGNENPQDTWNRAAHWQNRPNSDKNGVYASVFMPDCGSVITGGSDGTIRRWDIRNLVWDDRAKGIADSPDVIGQSSPHKDRITALAVAADRKPPTLLSASEDGTAKLWNLELTNTKYQRRQPPGGAQELLRAYNSNGRELVNNEAPKLAPKPGSAPTQQQQPTQTAPGSTATQPTPAKPADDDPTKPPYQCDGALKLCPPPGSGDSEGMQLTDAPAQGQGAPAQPKTGGSLFGGPAPKKTGGSLFGGPAPGGAAQGSSQPPANEKTAPIVSAIFTADHDAIILAPEKKPIVPISLIPGKTFQGLSANALDHLFGNRTNPSQAATCVAMVPFPSSNSALFNPMNGFANRMDNDDAAIPRCIGFATDKGDLNRINVQEARDWKLFRFSNESTTPYFDMALTERGNWFLAARSNGVLERVVNDAVTREDSSTSDTRCIGTREQQAKYNEAVRLQVGARSKAVQFLYTGHHGPATGVRPIVLEREATESSDVTDVDGVVSIGFDGTLRVWRLLDSCDAIERLNQPQSYDNKAVSVFYSDYYLSSLDVSYDSNYAVTGTLTGEVLLWWIGKIENVSLK